MIASMALFLCYAFVSQKADYAMGSGGYSGSPCHGDPARFSLRAAALPSVAPWAFIRGLRRASC